MWQRILRPRTITKRSVLLRVKPWDDETDMDAMLKSVRTIQKKGPESSSGFHVTDSDTGVKMVEVTIIIEKEEDLKAFIEQMKKKMCDVSVYLKHTY